MIGILVACQGLPPPPAAPVPTSAIHLEAEAVARGDGSTSVVAILREGSSDVADTVVLEEGALLRLVHPAGDIALERVEGVDGSTWYEAGAPADAEGTELRLALERPDEPDAPDTWVALPAPIEILAPAEGEAFSRAEDAIELRWSPSGTADRVTWWIEGPCVRADGGEAPADEGALTIPAGRLADHAGAGNDSCDADLELARERDGAVDPGLAGGAFTARQVDVVEVGLFP